MWTNHISEDIECSFLFPTLLDNLDKSSKKKHLIDHYFTRYFLFDFSLIFKLKRGWLIMVFQGAHGFMKTHKWRDSIGASINVEASGTSGPGRM